MKQETFTDIEYSYRKKKTKRKISEIMDEIIPGKNRFGVIEPYYPKGKRGRPPMGIEKMLRMYLLQTGLTCRIRRLRMQSMTAMPCGNLRALSL